MILKFINRERELKILEEAYRSQRPGFLPVYGRRRVGKTELIKHFIKDKAHFYFLAKKRDIALELERFRLKFSEEFNVFIPESKTWDELFEYILKQIKEKLIIVIDEFPFWIEKDSAIISDFQHLWDETLKKKNIFLILCGSSVSIMETDVLGYKSPLYGRRTGQLEVTKLNFAEFSKFFPRWGIEDKIKGYGALDGIPFYIQEFDQDKSFFDNVRDTFWKSGSILSKEVEFLLSQELREVEVYLSILRSIFEGASTLGEIASKSNVDITNINKYLRVLIDLRYITTETPVSIEKPKRKNFVYKLTDNFFSFWFNYVYPYRDEVEIGEIKRLEAAFKKDYDRYLGYVFEEICKQQLRSLKLPITPTKIGRWWYKEDEIDILCLDETANDNKEALFIECKWKELDEKSALAIIEKLKEKSKLVALKRKKEYFGMIAKKLDGKERLRNAGYIVFDTRDF
ncbi:ATP-binding protein [Candidatus Woesearchaeota archaeon]|nr:ATP-binding protein [Candidatus Woesearchaeota archaeon]